MLLEDPRLDAAGVRVHLVHDDNKARKLKYNLADARAAGHHTLLTFGGAWSNHIRATAVAGAREGFRTIGVVRGEEHLPLNEVLAEAAAHGMHLTYLDRATYRRKHTPEVIAALHAEHGDFHLLPEGGSNAAAARGCAELPAALDFPYTVLTCAVGTGGTLAGVAAGLPPGARAVGFVVLKGAEYLAEAIRTLQREAFGTATPNWTLDHTHHHGGYAKRTAALDAFIEDFRTRHGIALNPVYEAKMMTGVYARAASGEFPKGTTIAALLV